MSRKAVRDHLRVDDLLQGGMKIIQDPSAPCFSMDTVLLADFTQVKAEERVIDLGTGCGILPLLLCVKAPECRIVGLELMERMADLARQSVALNKLEEKISIVCGDIKDSLRLFGNAAFQVVVSNPPYYKVGAGRSNDSLLFSAARSEAYCPLPLLLDRSEALLAPLGRLYLIYRAARAGELLGALAARKLHVERMRSIHPFSDREANLLLIEAKKGGRGETHILPPLVVYQSPGCYSEEMERIYGGDPLSGGDAHR